MWLILHSEGDISARWAYEGLHRFTHTPIELLTAEDIEGATEFEHKLGGIGTTFKIQLADGRSLSNETVSAVLNRLLGPSPYWLTQSETSDARYVYDELYAIYVSWLSGFAGKVINRPSDCSLCGPALHSAKWAHLAREVGFKIRPYCQSTESRLRSSETTYSDETYRVLVLEGEVFGTPVPNQIQSACRALARSTGADLLGVELSQLPTGDLAFTGATSTPDLPNGGDEFLEALAHSLSSPVAT
jgi:hypothetical protein